MDMNYKIYFVLVHILAQLEKSSQINGVVVIMDYEGLSMKQIKAITPTATKRLLTFIQEAMMVRLREVHFVKQPFIFNMVWTLFKPFVKEKLKNRVFTKDWQSFKTRKFYHFLLFQMYFHGDDMKKLHKHIPVEYLPKNYGGTLPEIDYSARDWYPCVEKNQQYVSEWGNFGFK